MSIRFIGYWLLLIALTAGCSSSYEPAKSPHVTTIWEDGHLAYVRDGQHYTSSFFMGNAAIDAVHGDPRAEAEARKGRNLEVGGFVFLLGALGTAGGALGVLVSDPSQVSGHETTLNVLLASAVVCDVAGLVFELSAIPHLYDSANIYNDDLDRAANDESAQPQLARPPRAPNSPLPGPRKPSLLPAARSEALPPPPPPPASSEAPASKGPPAAAFPPAP
ncbi:MAG TPA: hypothetical protein VGM44_25055 [Polyangiaceae bacterium]|jgi:hypothetical protein